jgi:hypothetical protein
MQFSNPNRNFVRGKFAIENASTAYQYFFFEFFRYSMYSRQTN